MNKQNMSMIRKQAQAGFTLIELIVVIVILGILAATALPKFSSLSGDARVASLNAAKGALAATAATAHGQWLINPSGTTTLVYEGSTITIGTIGTASSGYPKADTGFTDAAGLSANDYKVTPNGTSLTIVPKSIDGQPQATTCLLSYTEPATVTSQPTFTLTATTDGCK